jgi:hypothetical protein
VLCVDENRALLGRAVPVRIRPRGDLVHGAGSLALHWFAANTTIEINRATQQIVRDNFTTTTLRRFLRIRVQSNP